MKANLTKSAQHVALSIHFALDINLTAIAREFAREFVTLISWEHSVGFSGTDRKARHFYPSSHAFLPSVPPI